MHRGAAKSGIRAVFCLSIAARGLRTQYPQDIMRLQRTYFSSKDQLLTLALDDRASMPKLFMRSRVRWACRPSCIFVGKDLSEPFMELGTRRAATARRRIHPLHWASTTRRGGSSKTPAATSRICAAIDMAMNPGHVDTVFIAGRVRKWRGSLVGVDMARVLAAGGGIRARPCFAAQNYTVNFLS